MHSKYRLLFGLAALVFAADQGTKALIAAYIPFHSAVEVIPGFFDLVHILNRGAAFGILNNPETDWQFWLFLCATTLAVGVILHLARTSPPNRLLFSGLGLILGGAIGNLADRLRWRAVLDFLDFHAAGMHWPAFNVADAGICIGAFLTCLALYKSPPETKAH